MLCGGLSPLLPIAGGSAHFLFRYTIAEAVLSRLGALRLSLVHFRCFDWSLFKGHLWAPDPL